MYLANKQTSKHNLIVVSTLMPLFCKFVESTIFLFIGVLDLTLIRKISVTRIVRYGKAFSSYLFKKLFIFNLSNSISL
jgi:hypothetical protein